MRLSAEPISARVARSFVVRTLDAWGHPELADTAELLTSELVTNVVRHGHTDMLLALHGDDDRVVVEVADESADDVRPREPDAEDVSGRGLYLVASMAQRWGVDRRTPGKSVWFELVPSH